MSNITNVSTQNLLSSFAGAQRTDLAKERATTEAKQSQKSQDILQLSIQKAENIADANSSTDRDAQGFYLPDDQPHEEKHNEPETSVEQSQKQVKVKLTPDVDAELGNSLDLEI